MHKGITLETDIRVSFDQLGIKFHDMMYDKSEELKALLQNILNNFDFETALKNHVEAKIRDSVCEAMTQIDLSSDLKRIIWAEIEKKLGGVV